MVKSMGYCNDLMDVSLSPTLFFLLRRSIDLQGLPIALTRPRRVSEEKDY
jgi:hypothetical protein